MHKERDIAMELGYDTIVTEVRLPGPGPRRRPALRAVIILAAFLALFVTFFFVLRDTARRDDNESTSARVRGNEDEGDPSRFVGVYGHPKHCDVQAGRSGGLPQRFQALDGSRNADGDAGSAGKRMRRYHRARDVVTPDARPSPRKLAREVLASNGTRVPCERGLSSLAWLWGEFITEMLVEAQSAPKDDDEGTPTNGRASFLDASTLYGRNADEAGRLRAFAGGAMRMAHGPDGPLCLDEEEEREEDQNDRRRARQKMHEATVALRALWLREHNRVAAEEARVRPDLNDEEVFQRARRRVVAQIQAVTYNEWLPVLVGRDRLDRPCYDARADPTVTVETALGALQFWLSMRGPRMERRHTDSGALMRTDDDDGDADDDWERRHHHSSHPDGPFGTHYSQPDFSSEGISPTLLGMARQCSERVDALLSRRDAKEVASIVAQSRAARTPDFVTLRWLLHGPPVTSWRDITSDPRLASCLARAYGATGWNEVDLLVGLLAEDHAPGAALGPTLEALLLDQLTRSRDADAYFYLWNPGLTRIRDALHATTLRKVLLRNTSIRESVLPRETLFKCH